MSFEALPGPSRSVSTMLRRGLSNMHTPESYIETILEHPMRADEVVILGGPHPRISRRTQIKAAVDRDYHLTGWVFLRSALWSQLPNELRNTIFQHVQCRERFWRPFQKTQHEWAWVEDQIVFTARSHLEGTPQRVVFRRTDSPSLVWLTFMMKDGPYGRCGVILASACTRQADREIIAHLRKQ